jgi:hypothetical protein
MAATHSRQPLTSAAECGERCAGWIVSEEPDCAAKEICIAKRRAAALLARHGVAGKKRCALGRVVEARAGFGDEALGAAHVGDQVFGAEDGGELLHEVERGVDGHREKSDLGCARGFKRVCGNGINRAHLERNLRVLRIAIPAGDGSGEVCGAQRHAH